MSPPALPAPLASARPRRPSFPMPHPGIARTVEIAPGVHMPRLALGTFHLHGDRLAETLPAALDAGCAHVDTASCYRNEAAIRDALRLPRLRASSGSSSSPHPSSESSAARRLSDAPFLTSKIAPREMRDPDGAVDAILARLGVAALDLALVHWPGLDKTAPEDADAHRAARERTWRCLERQLRLGRVRAIGVSNYAVAHLRELESYATVRPAVNQVESHPRLVAANADLERYCAERGIHLVAYSPLGCGDLLGAPEVAAAANALGCAASRALIAWALRRGWSVAVKCSSAARARENFGEGSGGGAFELAGRRDERAREAFAALDGMDDGTRYCWDPNVVR